MTPSITQVHVPQGMHRFEKARPPWGWRFSLATAGIFAGTYIAFQVISIVVIVVVGIDVDDIDTDRQALTILLLFGLIQQTASVVLAALLTRTPAARLVEGLGLNRWHWTSLWRPALMTLALYAGVAGWAIFLEWLDIKALDPESNVNEDFVDGPALIIISFFLIVIGAPLSEEFVFRGAIFGGLLRFGFWPAALVSGFLFALVHFNLGLIPAFTAVGVGMAYLYYSRGSLWDNIICHGMFNFTSYLLLISGSE